MQMLLFEGRVGEQIVWLDETRQDHSIGEQGNLDQKCDISKRRLETPCYRV
ncbi:MAG: hypothetical protein ACR2NZ_16485 [Rubripirellula sp.]